MKNKIAKLILNPEPYMDDFSYRNPKNGYISEEARKKARLKRKRKNKK